MKAVQLHAFGDPDVLVYEDTVKPEPGAGEVLIRVRAAGINPADWRTRRGKSGAVSLMGPEPFPVILGWDVSGEIEALGAGVSEFAVGDAVFGMLRFPYMGRTYAEYTTAPVGDLVRKPASISHQEAAALPLAALTAWQALFDGVHLEQGQSILIHAAAGGVGHLAVQLAKWKGAHVIGTASARNADYLRQLGVDTVIDYTSQRFEEIVHDVDVVFDGVGEDTQERSFQVLKRGGHLVSILSAPDEAKAQQYGIHGQRWAVHLDLEDLQQLTDLVAAGKLQVTVGEVMPLREARKAHEQNEAGHTRGKIVLEP
jgi:NADPH:quinone reductase-like Zn-dependent oxidoreductase